MALAMMHDAGFNEQTRKKLWAEAMNTASFLGDIFPTSRSKTPAYELFHGSPCTWYESLIEYGRIGMIATKKKGKKLETQGQALIMVGYALNHKVGSYRMYNPTTNKIAISDSIAWSKPKQWRASDDMRSTFTQQVPGLRETTSIPDATPVVVQDDLDEEDGEIEKKTNTTTTTPPVTKAKRMLSELATSYNNLNDVRVTGNTSVTPIGIQTTLEVEET